MKQIYASNMGDIVLCDLCNEDYTSSDEEGGFVFGSKGVCPTCAPRMMSNIEKYKETQYIKARPNTGESFADFIRRFRGGNATIEIYSL
jgi:hypothetical protein